MAEFQELIKNFNKCRDYVRDFFVYGFKSRQDFTSNKKSARTYDDERRRITSWLSEYVVEDMTEQNHVKNISLQLDSNLLDTNPLFSVWKTKSFTDNDIMLHFYLLDILGGYTYSSEHNKTVPTGSYSTSCHHTFDDADFASSSRNSKHSAYSANELADILSEDYSFPADTQLVRRKCNEYVKEGLLETEKEGKTLLYKCSLTWDELFKHTVTTDFKKDRKDNNSRNKYASLSEHVTSSNKDELCLTNAISFFQLVNPFGYIGNTITEKLQSENKCFRIKHSFPTFTLEEEIAYDILCAKNDHSYIKMDIINNRSGQNSHPIYGVPLKIFVSTRTGRRYVCIYHMIHEKSHNINREHLTQRFHFLCIRLDQIKAVTIITLDVVSEKKRATLKSTIDAFEAQKKTLDNNLSYVWGVSFEGMLTKVELTLSIDEEYEKFILNRLEREGKSGIVTRISDNTFLYEKIVFDANEMFPWLRTFIGRIMDIHFIALNQNGDEIRENLSLRKQFLEDINSMIAIYS